MSQRLFSKANKAFSVQGALENRLAPPEALTRISFSCLPGRWRRFHWGEGLEYVDAA